MTPILSKETYEHKSVVKDQSTAFILEKKKTQIGHSRTTLLDKMFHHCVIYFYFLL